MDQRVWNIMGRRLKYTKAQLDKFQARPANSEILEKAATLNGMEIVARVVSSHGCNSGHTIGQEIVFDGAGNLVSARAPAKLCIFLLGNMSAFIYGVHELVYAGVSPGEIQLRINRAGCSDVGIENCGWGRVILEISVRRTCAEKA